MEYWRSHNGLLLPGRAPARRGICSTFMVNQLNGFWAGGSAPAFSPLDITGCQLWVRSDLGVTDAGGGACSSWADQSGNGRDLTEGTNRPSIQTNQVNGYSGIRFDGSNDKLTTGSFSLSTPFTTFGVQKVITNTSGRRIQGSVTGTGGGGQVLRGTNSLALEDPNVGDGPSTSSHTTGTYFVVKGVTNGTSSLLSLNNGSDATSGTNLSHGIAGGWQMGAYSGANFANVEFAEFLIYNSAVSGANLTSLLGYFQTRYALW